METRPYVGESYLFNDMNLVDERIHKIMYDTEIEVVNLEDDKSFQDELTEDLMTNIHHFGMRFHREQRKSYRLIGETTKSFEKTGDK